jgi:DNA-directed RNA polymerase subunit RPC12/RpoP
MAEKVINYQCPNCTGPLRFDNASGQLACEHCDTKFDVSVIEQLYADKEQAAASGGAPEWDVSMAGGAWSTEETAHMRSYNCPSCAAEIICDDTTAATACPYCGNPSIVPGQFAGDLKPDYAIPFQLDKKNAVAALKNYYKGKPLLPSSFASDNHIHEVKGVYVPFWLFDGESEANMRFHGTIVHFYSSGDYDVTETDHYRVVREGTLAFEKIPVDGSSKMPDAHMDSIEPFDYSGLKPFSAAYMPGFLADKYDVDAKESSARANARINASTESVFRSTASQYASLIPEYTDIQLKKGSVKYALLPVWMLASTWNGKKFLFAMNGQTGKLIGDLPVSGKRFAAYFLGMWLALMIVFAVGMLVIGGIF